MINEYVSKLKGSATFEVKEKCRELKSLGKKVYSLGIGQSPFSPPLEVINSFQKHVYMNRYAPAKGIPELREAIVNFYDSNHNLSFNTSQVSVGTGAKELLFLLQLATDASLILPTPCWSSYGPQAIANGKTLENGKLQLINTKRENRWLLTVDELQEFCKRDSIRSYLDDSGRILMLNYPGNPTGQTYTTQNLKDFANVCRDNNIIVVSDEIYSLLTYDGDPDSIARYYPEGTIICSGLSKWCSAGGWRLGTFIFPKELQHIQKALTNIISEDSSSPCTPVQWAAIDAFNGKFDNKYVGYCRDILSIVGRRSAEILDEAGIITAQPEGGFYLFIDLENYRERLNHKGIHTCKEAYNLILAETGVAVIPGEDFMRNPEELSARVAYIDFDGDKVLSDIYNNGLNEDIILDGCHNTIEAMEVLANWVRAL